MVIKSFINSLANSISSNFRDVNVSRWKDGERWVYTLPVSTQLPKYPRIHIMEVSSPRTPREVNSDLRRVDSMVQISVLWSVEDKVSWDGSESVEQAEEGLFEFVERLEYFINKNQDSWRDKGVLSARSVDVRSVSSGKSSVLRRDLDIRVFWDSESFGGD